MRFALTQFSSKFGSRSWSACFTSINSSGAAFECGRLLTLMKTTKNYFFDWPMAICCYLTGQSHPIQGLALECLQKTWLLCVSIWIRNALASLATKWFQDRDRYWASAPSEGSVNDNNQSGNLCWWTCIIFCIHCNSLPVQTANLHSGCKVS